MQQVLRDGDVDQGGVDIPVAQVGREERQAILRIDAGPVPFEDPVHDHRVAQVVETRTGSPRAGLQLSPANDVDEQPSDGLLGVYWCTALLVPEQAGSRILRCSGTAPCIDIGAEARPSRCRDNGRILVLKNLVCRIVIVPALKVDVTQIEAGELAPPQTRAVGQQQHGVDG